MAHSATRPTTAAIDRELEAASADGSPSVTKASLSKLVDAVEAAAGLVASAPFPDCMTTPVMLEVWLGWGLTSASPTADGGLVQSIVTRGLADRFVFSFGHAGLVLASVLMARPDARSAFLVREVARLRLAHLGFPGSEPALGTITGSRAIPRRPAVGAPILWLTRRVRPTSVTRQGPHA